MKVTPIVVSIVLAATLTACEKPQERANRAGTEVGAAPQAVETEATEAQPEVMNADSVDEKVEATEEATEEIIDAAQDAGAGDALQNE